MPRKDLKEIYQQQANFLELLGCNEKFKEFVQLRERKTQNPAFIVGRSWWLGVQLRISKMHPLPQFSVKGSLGLPDERQIMKCITSPALDNVEIAMYVDGEADEAVIAHIQKCPYCSERAREMALLQNRLRKQSYRVHCPTSIELGDCHLGYLPVPRALVVSNHVQGCLLCQQEVEVLESFLTDLAPETSLSGVVKTLMARLMGEGPEQEHYLSSILVLAGLGLRGRHKTLIYQANPVQIIFEVQEDVEQMGLKISLGLVTGLETNKFTIQVSRWGQPIATTSVEEIGIFNIPIYHPVIIN